MDYKEFVSAVEEKVNVYLEEGVCASLHTTVKNNGKRKRGIMVVREGVNISPTIYLEEFYEQYKRGNSFDTVIKDVLRFYDTVKPMNSWKGEFVHSYEEVKSRIVFQLINREKNQDMVSMVPCIPYLDLLIVFYVLLEVGTDGTAIMLVRNENVKEWGVCAESLFAVAQENARRLLPAEFSTMSCIVQDIIDAKERVTTNLLDINRGMEQDTMYVLTNKIRNLGAACMAYDHILEMIGTRLEENYYILPSSVHEVIIVPESKSPTRAELDAMICEINATQVKEEEVLSNRAYYYSRKSGQISL